MATAFDSLPRLQIDQTNNGRITVILDGNDISNAVRSINLDISADRYGTTEFATATIELFVKAQVGVRVKTNEGEGN